jgi:hypothetical protein
MVTLPARRAPGRRPGAAACRRPLHLLLGAPPLDSAPFPSLSQVHKFGGTCVAAAERIEAICRYLIGGADGAPGAQEGEQRVVVVSAMGSHPSSPVKVRGVARCMRCMRPLCALCQGQAAASSARLPRSQAGDASSYLAKLSTCCRPPCGGKASSAFLPSTAHLNMSNNVLRSNVLVPPCTACARSPTC